MRRGMRGGWSGQRENGLGAGSDGARARWPRGRRGRGTPLAGVASVFECASVGLGMGDGGGRASHLVGGWRCGEGLGRGDGRRDGSRGRVAHGLAERDGQLLALGQHLGRGHHDGWGVAEPPASRGVVRFVSRVDSRARRSGRAKPRASLAANTGSRGAPPLLKTARACVSLAPRRGRVRGGAPAPATPRFKNYAGIGPDRRDTDPRSTSFILPWRRLQLQLSLKINVVRWLVD